MNTIQFDHFITYINAPNIDDYLKEYEKQGFAVHEQTVRHDPGLRNGFVPIGVEYLEFCWVEDEELFKKGNEEKHRRRAILSPFGIGLIADDLAAGHNDWIARGFDVPDLWSKAARDDAPGSPPVWTFQDIPKSLLPGAWCFGVTYHSRPKGTPRKLRSGANTIYALSGITMVTEHTEQRAQLWRNLLAPDARMEPIQGGVAVEISPHRVEWLPPASYEKAYGISFPKHVGELSNIALLHFLAADLIVARSYLEDAGRTVHIREDNGHTYLVVAPDPRDGFAFTVRQYPMDLWKNERIAKTGEILEG